jgi:hypothetical protein
LETFEKLGSKAKVKDFKAVLDNQKLTAKQVDFID